MFLVHFKMECKLEVKLLYNIFYQIVSSHFQNKNLMEPHSHVPYGDDGSGLYSDSCENSRVAIYSTDQIFQDCIKAVLQRLGKNPPVFVIADYGTADGGVSMPLFYSAIELLKEMCGKNQNVHVIYEDQATNDFKSLFLRLNGTLLFLFVVFCHWNLT